ncbi:MAG: InlB B-repeat-containing protein [Sedimentisphaerales bacterium]|nr:InlB B-repeat-containing protein [Sedimentisphaerales bacterium]
MACSKQWASRIIGIPVILRLSLIFLAGHSLAFGATQVTKNGIVWYFDKDYTVGEYINGDFWVRDNGQGVTVTRVTPSPQGSGINFRNGSEVNPIAHGRIDYRSGFDGRALSFDSSLSVVFPVVLHSGDSLVSTISAPAGDEVDYDVYGAKVHPTERGTKYAAVLTCVSTLPQNDEFRPPYAGQTKTVYRAGQIKWDLLPELHFAGTPTITEVNTITRMLREVWLDHINQWPCERIHNYGDMPHYGREIGHVMSRAGVLLCLDYTKEQLHDLTIHFIQRGIDFYGMSRNGRIWNGDHGGYHNGRKFSIFISGVLLDDQNMKSIGFGDVPFGEDDQTYYGTTPSKNASQQHVAYFGADCPDIYYQNGCSGSGEKTCRPRSLDADACPDYRGNQTSATWVGQCISVRVFGLENLWGHDAWFDYVDRWMAYGDDPPVVGGDFCTNTYVEMFWDTFRPLFNAQFMADAGSDQTVDSGEDGYAEITLHGNEIHGYDVQTWIWEDNLGDSIPDSQTSVARLSVGDHSITLTITDQQGQSDSDTVRVLVRSENDTPLIYSNPDSFQLDTPLDFEEISILGLPSSQGTILLWAQPAQLTGTQYLFGHTVGSWSNRIQLYLNDGNLCLGLGDSHTVATNIQPFTTNLRRHVALTWNNRQYSLYFQGENIRSGNYAGLSSLNSYADFGNTGHPDFRNEGFSGVISDVRIYNTALDSTEIQQIYTEGIQVQETYQITASAGTGGSISPSGTVTVVESTSQTFTIQSDTGYYLSGVTVDSINVGTMETYLFNNVTEDHTIAVSFSKNQYSLQIEAQNGTVLCNPSKAMYEHGDTVTLTATPATGYKFVGWNGVNSSNGNIASVVMDKDKTVTATFDLKTYALTISTVNGSVTRTPAKTEYQHGETVTLTAIPNTGYVFTGWNGDLIGSLNPRTFIMDDDISVTASFTALGYSINVSATNGNIIKIPDKTAYTLGETVTLRAAAQNNFHFSGWGGHIDGSVNPFQLVVDGNKTISASFTENLAFADSIQDNGMIGHWKLNNHEGTDNSDSTGISQFARLLNGATWGIPYENLAKDEFVILGGEDDAIAIPMHRMNAEQGTVSIWARWDNVAGSQYLFGHETDTDTNCIQLYTNYRTLHAKIGNADSSIISIEQNRLMMITLTWDGINFNVYLDGQIYRTGVYADLNSLNSIAFVGNNPQMSAGLQGEVEDIRIFNRALDYTEVRDLFLTYEATEDRLLWEELPLPTTALDGSGIVYTAQNVPIGALALSGTNTLTWRPSFDQGDLFYEIFFTASGQSEMDRKITILVDDRPQLQWHKDFRDAAQGQGLVLLND